MKLKNKSLIILSVLVTLIICLSIYFSNLGNVKNIINNGINLNTKVSKFANYRINVEGADKSNLPPTIKLRITGVSTDSRRQSENINEREIDATLSSDKSYYAIDSNSLRAANVEAKENGYDGYEISLLTGIPGYLVRIDDAQSNSEVSISKYVERTRISNAERIVVNMPDAKLKAKLLEGFKNPEKRGVDVRGTTVWINPNIFQLYLTDRIYVKPDSETEIYEDEMEMITSFSGNFLGITDLTGFEKAKNILQFFVLNNPKFDITPVIKNKLLEIVGLIGIWGLEDVSPLTNAKNLTRLTVTDTALRDLSGVNGLPKLEVIDAWNNQISDLSVLRDMPSLKSLNVSNNPVSDLRPVVAPNAMPRLEGFYASNSRITDVSPLATSNIKSLDLNGNSITNHEELSKMINLTEWLNLRKTGLRDLNKIRGINNNLKALNIEENEIEDLTPLETKTNLIKLFAKKNNITDLTPVSKLTNLLELGLEENKITDFSKISNIRGRLTSYNAINQKINVLPTSIEFNLPEFKYSVTPTSITEFNSDKLTNRGNNTYKYNSVPYERIEKLAYTSDTSSTPA